PTLLLGAAFLSIGVLLSALTSRHATATSLAVVVWFLFVFFYDLRLLGAMVAPDGALPQWLVAWLVSLNPAGLYRTSLMMRVMGDSTLSELGLVVSLPGPWVRAALWTAWIAGPTALGAALLLGRRSVTA